jgi:hypothetical protein
VWQRGQQPAAAVAALNVSPRVHDDWAVVGATSIPSVDVAPGTHDDWMLPVP